MVSVIIAETMMKLNQALRKNTFQSGLYLMVDLPSNSCKTLYRAFNWPNNIDHMVDIVHMIHMIWYRSYDIHILVLKTRLIHQTPISIFDLYFPSYSGQSKSNNLHQAAEIVILKWLLKRFLSVLLGNIIKMGWTSLDKMEFDPYGLERFTTHIYWHRFVKCRQWKIYKY